MVTTHARNRVDGSIWVGHGLVFGFAKPVNRARARGFFHQFFPLYFFSFFLWKSFRSFFLWKSVFLQVTMHLPQSLALLPTDTNIRIPKISCVPCEIIQIPCEQLQRIQVLTFSIPERDRRLQRSANKTRHNRCIEEGCRLAV